MRSHGDTLTLSALLEHGRRLTAGGVLAALAWLGSGELSAADLYQQPARQPTGTPNIVVAPGGLRWRNVDRTAQEAVASGRLQPAGRVTQIDPFVEPASQVQQAGWVQRAGGEQPVEQASHPSALQPIRPIADPYGERVAQGPAPIRPRSAPIAPAPMEELAPPGGVGAEPILQPPAGRPMSLQPMPMIVQPEEAPAPRPMPMRVGPGVPSRVEEVPLGDPMPRRPAPPYDAPMRRGADCDKIYNTRNFCEEDGECRAAIRSLANKPLSAISLDTTPSFDPTATDRPAAEARMKERLGAAESREWKNRLGEVVATGRLIDFVKGDVIIAQENGQTTQIVARRLDDDSHAFLNAWWGLPHDCRLSDEQYKELAIGDYRHWDHPLTMSWTASALCHKPLYFEETCLERYGHTTGPWSQPFVSGAHFFGNIAFLPYKLGMDPYNECQYALGYYRPGSCAPWYIPATPISPRGAATMVGFYWGAGYIIP